MCNIRKTWYTCGCGISTTISSCRTTFSRYRYSKKTKSTSLVVRCKPKPWLELMSSNMCGPCQYAPIKQHWDDVIAKAEAETSDLYSWAEGYDRMELKLLGLREQRDSEEWQCRWRFPVAKKEPEEAENIIRKVISAKSPLRNELLLDDIKDQDVVSPSVYACVFSQMLTTTRAGAKLTMLFRNRFSPLSMTTSWISICGWDRR
jgi:hypothetical protein